METTQHLILSALSGQAITFDHANLPARLKLLNWGMNQTCDGDLVVNERTVDALSRQIAGDTFARIVLDFEHQSLKGHPNYKEAPRHNAARGDLEVVAGDGIYITGLSWTPKGIEHGADFGDLSPVVVHTKRKASGEPAVVLGIVSAALCDNGRVQGITAFSADYPTPQETHMKDIEKLTADLEAQSQQITAQAALIKELQTRLDQPPAITAESFDQVKALATSAATGEALVEGKQQISALSARLDSLQKDHMIQLAVIQGKAVTLDEAAITAMSADSLAQHITGLGVTLPVLRKTPTGDVDEGKTETSANAAQIDALLTTVRRETGLTDFSQVWSAAKARQPDLFKK